MFDVIGHLPQEAQEALLKLAVGEKPEPQAHMPAEADGFAHPDAQRRFRVLKDVEELRQALDYPWEKWAVFLHPAQEALVKKNYTGPVRVSGSAGTGKTIVALHRAVHLAKSDPQTRILLTTFSNALANALKKKLVSLVSSDPTVSARITVKAIGAVGYDLFVAHFGEPQLASTDILKTLITQAAAETPGHKFPMHFLFGEWTDVVDVWQLKTREAYRDVSRLGRKTRMGGKQREVLWSIYERVLAALAERNLITRAGMFGKLTDRLDSGAELTFDYAVIDEAQDLSVPEARFLSVLTGKKPNGLFLAGDLGQRIFQQPFSWKALGLDVRGRSFTLRINYRTSHQIRVQADRLLPGSVSDVDGNSESRKGTVSVFDGPPPLIVACKKAEEERDRVAQWISARLRDGCEPHEIGVFVRSEEQMERARAALKAAATLSFDLNNENEASEGRIALGTMHAAKGLEFRSVVVMACDDEVIPLQERIENIADDAALEEVYDTERHLLYVACTRARDSLLVTGVEPVSEFLDDLRKPTH